MEDNLMLPVACRGQELEFPFKLTRQGFAYRFLVWIDEVEVMFENDDSGELRAFINNAETFTGKLPERELLGAIARSIQTLQS